MPITLDGSNGITTPTYGGADTSEYLVPVTQFKNRIINGAMIVNQRATTITTGAYSVDRWEYSDSSASKASIAQSTIAPTGYINSLGATSSSAYSVTSSDYFMLRQKIEGLNVADLNWGTANAQTVTLSFWVRSSLTGTFGGALTNSGSTRSYPFSYTISSANTWEQKSITIAGDTTGTWLTTNGIGIEVRFGLGVGSTFSGTAGAWAGSNFISATGATSVVGTNGATFYITGIQLEVGSTATSFDYRPYGTELQLCQRYYLKLKGTAQFDTFGSGYCESTTTIQGASVFPVTMRTSPTALEQSGTAADYLVRVSGTGPTCSAVPTFTTGSPFVATSTFTVASGLTAGQGGLIRANNSTAFLAWSAEL